MEGEPPFNSRFMSIDFNSRYMSIVPILNMLGSLAAYPMGEWLGRKKVLIFERCQYSVWKTKYLHMPRMVSWRG